MNNDEGLKILMAEAENFKCFDYKLVELDGMSIVAIGKNGAGKSSLIDMLASPVDANFVPLEPVKQGADMAKIKLKIGGNIDGQPQEYTIVTEFSPGSSTGKLKLFNKDGNEIKKGAASILKSIIGNIGFDIFKFISLGTTANGKVSESGLRQQIETLKGLMPAETQNKLFDLDQERDSVFSARTEINGRIKILQSELAGSSYSQEEIEKYSKDPINTEAVSLQLEALNKKIENWTKVESGVATAEDQMVVLNDTITDLEKRLKDAKTKQAELADKIIKGKQWLVANEKPNPTSLQDQLRDAGNFNTNCLKVKQYLEKHETLVKIKKESEDKTKRLEEIDTEKKKVFSSDSFPVKGISFDENQIYYNGLPFNEKNVPKSHIWAIGVKISMLMNPNLRVIFIKDGSLLDDDTVKAILGMAKKYGYQIIMEVVDRTKEELEIKWIEKYLNNEQ